MVRDRVPARSALDALAIRGADTRVSVERAKTHGEDLRLARRPAEQAGAADAAEDLDPAARRREGGEQLLALRDSQRAGIDTSLSRCRRAGAALAVLAVAVARRARRFAELEADTAAQAAAGQRLRRSAPRYGERLEHIDRGAGHVEVRMLLQQGVDLFLGVGLQQ